MTEKTQELETTETTQKLETTQETEPKVKAEKKAEKPKPQQRTEDNIIFIGAKPFMNYVTGIVMQFTAKAANKVTIKSRGKFISKAVDVAEVVRKRFLEDQDIAVKEINIDSEEFENPEGRKVNVSTMEIVLEK